MENKLQQNRRGSFKSVATEVNKKAAAVIRDGTVGVNSDAAYDILRNVKIEQDSNAAYSRNTHPHTSLSHN